MRTFGPGDERELYEADKEAFAEDWSRPERSFEDWWSKFGGAEKFDPDLTFLAWDGAGSPATRSAALRSAAGS